MVEVYFFDTYALVEVTKGNKNYAKYAECECKTSIFNLAELYYFLLRDFDKSLAMHHFKRLRSNLLEINDEDVFIGMQLKLSSKKQNLSYADCLGYAMAKNHGIRFLTGDEKFETIQNVEYVK